MSDTNPKIEAMLRERYKRMSPDERVRIAASMFETAREIVLSSLPSNLSRRERRLAVARRLYRDELPEAALIAHAEWPHDADTANPSGMTFAAARFPDAVRPESMRFADLRGRFRTCLPGGRPPHHRRLTEAERTALAPYVARDDLDGARLHDGRVPGYLPGRFIAIARGNRIYFRPGHCRTDTVDGLALLAHELVHVGQYRRGATWLTFILSYLRHGYRRSPLEVAARETAERIRRDLGSGGADERVTNAHRCGDPANV